jgi:mycothiol system anti-sigma-R factor
VDLSPIDCERALRKLELLVDEELDPREADVVRRHLGDCPPCGDRAEFRRRLKIVLAAKCCEEMPRGLWARIERHLVDEGAPDPSA